ncbi:MAG: exodeoxyribonuclease VII large subunit [Hyphomicrobiaceae bacterium]|nr:exodeoxyribonuclease VII large subunit [Hyphomicrobiaceae bacterium]
MSDAPSNAHEYTVSELSQSVKNTIEDEFGFVRVRGEVGRVSKPGSGHLYFDLKDDRSVLAAVAWKGTASRWRFQPEQGLEVVATGRLTTFPGQSKYQLIVENVEPAGLGALMALLEERRKKLQAEGLFDEARKQELPYLPRIIGVVTSPTGAVIRDILHRLADRFPTHVIVWPVRVQGEGCAPEVAAAIEGFNMLPPDGPIARPDLLIVARGGGSVEDLWGFNEEIVVRAIAESELPVISAIGHETDFTLADFAADRRAPTPTGAAEMAVPVRAELLSYVDDQSMRLKTAMRNLASRRRDRLRAASAALPRPAELLGEARQRLDLASTRLASALRHAAQSKGLQLAQVSPRLAPSILSRRIVDARQRLRATDRARTAALSSRAQTARARLDPLVGRLRPAALRLLRDRKRHLTDLFKLASSLGYRNVLARGFALVTDSQGNVLRAPSTVADGDPLLIELAEGSLDAVAGKAHVPHQPPPKGPRKPRSGSDDGQESLF